MNNNKLPEPFKSDWIKALQSGKYKQGKSRLYRTKDDTYCCLGVAEHILGTPNEQLRGVGMPQDLKGYSRFPAGLSNCIINLLANMNDRGVTFEHIADYIEENL